MELVRELFPAAAEDLLPAVEDLFPSADNRDGPEGDAAEGVGEGAEERELTTGDALVMTTFSPF